MATHRNAGEGSSRPSRWDGRGTPTPRESKRKSYESYPGRPTGRISLIEAMKIKIEEAEKKQEKTPEERECRFGKTVLPILDPNDPQGFIPLDNLPIDQQQKCLLDALWLSRNKASKLNACCALQYYFSKIMEPPQGKNFSYYALLNGPGVGIYCYYSSLVSAKEGLTRPQYKGFYSFTEAINYVWDNVYDKNAIIYIEEEPRDGPLLENYQAELRNLRDQINELITEISELKKPETILYSPTPPLADIRMEDQNEDDDRRHPRNLKE